MLNEKAGDALKVSGRADGQSPRLHSHCEAVGEIYRAIHTSGLYTFTFVRVDAIGNDLLIVLQDLERLPEETLVEMMEVIEGLRAAAGELRLARFLFEEEEIDPLYRLVMRNRAVLRSEALLERLLRVWPAGSPVRTFARASV